MTYFNSPRPEDNRRSTPVEMGAIRAEAGQFLKAVDDVSKELEVFASYAFTENTELLDQIRYLTYFKQVVSLFTRQFEPLSSASSNDFLLICQSSAPHIRRIYEGLDALSGYDRFESLASHLERSLDGFLSTIEEYDEETSFLRVVGYKDYGMLVKGNDIAIPASDYEVEGHITYVMGIENLPVVLESNNLLVKYAYEEVALDLCVVDLDGSKVTFGLKDFGIIGFQVNDKKVRALELLAGSMPEDPYLMSYTEVHSTASRIETMAPRTLEGLRSYLPRLATHCPPFAGKHTKGD